MRKLIPYVVVFALGIGTGMYIGSDSQYKITRENSQPFLYNRKTSEKQPITDNFQLGTLDYRIEGIKAEIRQISTKQIEKVVKDAAGN